MPAGVWLHGAARNAVRAEGGTESVPPPPNEMCSTSSPTGWCHCHHNTTSALCRAERRSVGALDRTPLPHAGRLSGRSCQARGVIYLRPGPKQRRAQSPFSIESCWSLFVRRTHAKTGPLLPTFAPPLRRHRHGRVGESAVLHSATGRLSR